MGAAFLRSVGAVAVTFAVIFVGACGYEAAPISVELRASPSEGGQSVPFSLSGTADPEASDFSTGILLWTRWATNRNGVRTVELILDLNRDHLPPAVGANDIPEELRDPDQVVATLRGRDSDGRRVLEQRALTVQVQVDRLADEGARELHQGTFSTIWPAGGPYSEIVGSWETRPRPGSSTPGGGDFAPAPGDYRRVGDTMITSGDDDVITFDSAGCSCVGEVDEDIPEEPTEPEPAPEDPTQDSGGCDCQGDSAPDEEPTEPDTSSSEEDSGGCDCEGDPSPDEDPTALRASSTIRIARIKRRPCHRGPLRMGMELSPLLFVWALSMYRRRRR